MSTGKASSSSTSRFKAAQLERIRNNQRRCRARRKEYVAELEDKIRQYESNSHCSSTALRLDELVQENESLKRLLQSLGLGDGFLKAYNKASHIAPEISRAHLSDESCYQAKEHSSLSPHVDSFNSIPTETYEPQTEDLTLSSSTNIGASSQELLQFSESSTQADSALLWEPLDFPTISTFLLGSLQTEIQPQDSVQSSSDSLIVETLSNTMLKGDTSDTTTLCSLAFSLVLKNNLKGYSAAELELKLRVGYRCGAAPSESCRIDNKILFSVLAEVS